MNTLERRIEKLEQRLSPLSGPIAFDCVFLCDLMPKDEVSEPDVALMAMDLGGDSIDRSADESAEDFRARVKATVDARQQELQQWA